MATENEDKKIESYPSLLGVSCDGIAKNEDGEEDDCYNYFEANILVSEEDTKDQKFKYIISLAIENGWEATSIAHPLTSLTFCPEHKHQAMLFK